MNRKQANNWLHRNATVRNGQLTVTRLGETVTHKHHDWAGFKQAFWNLVSAQNPLVTKGEHPFQLARKAAATAPRGWSYV